MLYIIIIVCLLILIYFFIDCNQYEHYSVESEEAIENIASLYNSEEMILSNLSVLGQANFQNLNADEITVNNISCRTVNGPSFLVGAGVDSVAPLIASQPMGCNNNEYLNSISLINTPAVPGQPTGPYSPFLPTNVSWQCCKLS